MIYVDTSALVKLVIPESETEALLAWMKSQVDATFFSAQLILATACSLKSHLGAFVTYDVRLAEAARLLGINAVSPE